MSVLNQSGEEQVECPLCMEPLEVDDLNFFPCTCGYQICRFCWHRIRTDENGLCPACRKAYSENPADFTPLSKEQVAQLKAEKRQRDQQRKAKLSESRKHLASVRVVQRNLVFVVGLPLRLADADTLKKHEYFGKFGKIHKVVINQSTSYAGSQGPSASAYVTYHKSEDALRAIQSVNNIVIDGRQIKSSLGTTKYCSHFMKNQTCPKPDCMYLHDFGDPEASFTKEQMHAGKHQEYEKKLHDALNNRTHQQQQHQLQQQQIQQSQAQTDPSVPAKTQSTAKSKESASNNSAANGSGANRDSWPQLNEKGDKIEGKKLENGNGKQNMDKDKSTQASKGKNKNGKNSNNINSTDLQKRPDKKASVILENISNNKDQCPANSSSSSCANKNTDLYTSNNSMSSINLDSRCYNSQGNNMIISCNSSDKCYSTAKSKDSSDSEVSPLAQSVDSLSSCGSGSTRSTLPLLDDNTSFFSSQNSFQKIVPESLAQQAEDELHQQNGGDINSVGLGLALGHNSQILNDTLPDITSTEDWEAAFGFSTKPSQPRSPGQAQLAGIAPPASVKDALDAFGNNFGCSLGSGSGTQINNRLLEQGFNTTSKLDMFSRLDAGSTGGYTSNKSANYDLNDGLLEALSKNNAYNHPLYKQANALDERLIPTYLSQQQQHQQQNHIKELSGNNGLNGLNGMDHMSKFFSDFYKNGQKDLVFGQQNGLTNQHGNLGSHTSLVGGQHSNLSNLTGLSNQLSGQGIPISNQSLTNHHAGLAGQSITNHSNLTNQHSGLNGLTNGLNGLSLHHHQNAPHQNSVNAGGSYLSMEDKQALFLMQHQRQISEQLINLHKQQQQQQQHGYAGLTNGMHGNGLNFLNSGELLQNGSNGSTSQGYGNQHLYVGGNNSLLGSSGPQKMSGIRNPEEELDFDPILETQKALAEIIQNETQSGVQQQHNNTNNSRSTLGSNQQPVNGMVHSQNSNNSHCPPPPGFMQSNSQSHLNNFVGSKILPFLNMGANQQSQQLNNTNPQNNWPNSYGQLPQQQHKPIGVCNDWKLIDPAIVRSAKQAAFPISNMSLRDQYNPLQQLGGLQNGPQTSGPFDSYGSSSAFSNFSALQQPGFSFLNSQSQAAGAPASQLPNWLTASDLVGPPQISSPPGFRNAQAAQGKQQEC